MPSDFRYPPCNLLMKDDCVPPVQNLMSEWKRMADNAVTLLQNTPADEYARSILLAQAYLSRQLLRTAKAPAAEFSAQDDSPTEKAIAALRPMRQRGLNDPEWCRLMAICCRLSGQRDAEALGYAMRWAELAPQDPEARRMAEACRDFLSEDGTEAADEDTACSETDEDEVDASEAPDPKVPSASADAPRSATPAEQTTPTTPTTPAAPAVALTDSTPSDSAPPADTPTPCSHATSCIPATPEPCATPATNDNAPTDDTPTAAITAAPEGARREDTPAPAAASAPAVAEEAQVASASAEAPAPSPAPAAPATAPEPAAESVSAGTMEDAAAEGEPCSAPLSSCEMTSEPEQAGGETAAATPAPTGSDTRDSSAALAPTADSASACTNDAPTCAPPAPAPAVSVPTTPSPAASAPSAATSSPCPSAASNQREPEPAEASAGAPAEDSADAPAPRTAMYSEEEAACTDHHMERYFGSADFVHREPAGPWGQVDVNLIPPSDEHPWFTLVTQGMGARAFRDEEGEEQRCELLMTLPPDWADSTEDWQRPDRFWPLHLLRLLARFPFATGEPIDWGHSFDLREELDEESGTDFCAAMLLSPGLFEEEAAACTLPDGARVSYWQVIPLYREEIQYKRAHGTEELLELFTDDMLSTADPRRLNAVADHALIKEESGHEAALQRCRTLTDYVQYCVENGLVRSGFVERHPDVEWAMRTALAEEHRDEGLDLIPPMPLRSWPGPLNCWATPSVLRGEGRIAAVSRDAVAPVNSGWDSGLNFLGEPELAAEEDSEENGGRMPLVLTNLYLISALEPQLPRLLGLEPRRSLLRADDGRFIPADEA